MRKSSKREFSVMVERDEDGYFVASVPALPGCHTQARSRDKLVDALYGLTAEGTHIVDGAIK